MTHCWCRDSEKLCLYYTICHQYIRIASNIYLSRVRLAKRSNGLNLLSSLSRPVIKPGGLKVLFISDEIRTRPTLSTVLQHHGIHLQQVIDCID